MTNITGRRSCISVPLGDPEIHAGLAHLIEPSDIFAIVLICHKHCLSPTPRLSLQVNLLYDGSANVASKPDFTEGLNSIDDDLVHRAANGHFADLD
jgi:hypothetical protein